MSIAEIAWSLFLPLVAVVVGIIHIRMKNLHGSQAVGTFLMWQIVIGLGFGYLYAAMGHLFAADKVAASIGWPAGSPFQREVGLWDASLGVVALLCLKFRNSGFWTATILGIGIFSVAAGLGHVYEMLVHGDYSLNNAGPVMWLDLFYPVYLVILLRVLDRKKGEEAAAGL
jgi:hypothetical protein